MNMIGTMEKVVVGGVGATMGAALLMIFTTADHPMDDQHRMRCQVILAAHGGDAAAPVSPILALQAMRAPDVHTPRS